MRRLAAIERDLQGARAASEDARHRVLLAGRDTQRARGAVLDSVVADAEIAFLRGEYARGRAAETEAA